MVEDEKLYLLFSLCNDKKKFIYEISNIFGNKLTVEELDYWTVFNIIERAKYYEINYMAVDLDEIVEMIQKEDDKIKRKRAQLG